MYIYIYMYILFGPSRHGTRRGPCFRGRVAPSCIVRDHFAIVLFSSSVR